MSKKKKVYPLPEAITPGPWTIEDTGNTLRGHTSRASKLLAAPLADDERGLHIRFHEMAHIKWSPASCDGAKHGVSNDTLNAVEDARVNYLLSESAGIDAVRATDILPETVQWPEPAQDMKRAVQFMVATYASGTQARMSQAYSQMLGDEAARAREIAETAIKLLIEKRRGRGNNLPAFPRTVEVARYIDEQCKVEEQIAEDEEQENGLADLQRKAHTLGTYERKGGKVSDRGARGVAWGRMDTQEPSRPIRMPRNSLGKRWRPTDMGAGLVYPDRYLSDKRCFRRKVRLPGGTLLIDNSSSMCLTAEDVERIIGQIPAATIADYSGDYDWGTLRILARDGTRVNNATLNAVYGGNCVDGPALDWLAKQPAPRIWVSDGGVTGIGDKHASELVQYCIDVCRKNGIIHVESMDDCRDWLKKKKNARTAY